MVLEEVEADYTLDRSVDYHRTTQNIKNNNTGKTMTSAAAATALP